LPEWAELVDYPRAGAHYPRSTGEFLAWFGIDEDCLEISAVAALAGRVRRPRLAVVPTGGAWLMIIDPGHDLGPGPAGQERRPRCPVATAPENS
jgi:hypothetical protein